MPSRSARYLAFIALATLLATGQAFAQQLSMPGDPLAGTVIESTASDAGTGSGAVQLTPGNPIPMGGAIGMSTGGPVSASSGGSYYNPLLGSHIRAQYRTQSYGQQEGTLNLGTMKLFQLDGGMGFVDGQVTMNDESTVGYNVGLGYRWLTLPLLPYSPDDEKIMGVSIWSDGQSVSGDNFFPQVGVSLEFLGDHLDFRANGYAPVGSRTQTRDFFDTGEITFTGNGVGQLLQGVQDTALTVGEAELAGRIADLDAWVFGGVYGFNGGAFDGVGGKVGVRGYATPDLMLSVAIANDDEFDTNALLSLTWFIGRTRVENCPTGTLRDRLREPVIRNSYVATQQSVAFTAGDEFLDPGGNAIRIVHVDSSAGAGGDGTFENPLNSLNDILANSLEDDIVLAHGGSVFTGQSATLQDGQTFVGEGGNNVFQISVNKLGTIDLPETAPGAQAGAIPTINNAPVAGVMLADNNTVQNLAFSGGVNAIMSDTVNGSFNPTLMDLEISGTSGAGILLDTVVRADVDDIDDDNNTTETINVMGNVVIDNVTFTNVGGNDIDIDAEASTADTNSGETIAISNVTSTGNTGAESISIANTNSTTGDAVTISNFTYNGGAGGQGGLLLTDTGGPVTVTESDFTGGVGPAVSMSGTSGVVTVGATNTITDVTGQAVRVVGNTASVTIAADIDTDAAISGGGVFIQSNEGIVQVNGEINANNFNAVVIDDAQANINFGQSSATAPAINSTGTGTAITITDAGNNTTDPAQITFNGDINNEQGRSVSIASGDDRIQFNGTVTDTGDGMLIANRDDSAGAQVLFNDQVTITTTGANNGVELSGNGDQSIVTFNGLDITTDSGAGIVADGGVLNVNGTDNTITTQTGRALDLTGGSSATGVTFDSIDVDGADRAILATNFQGNITVNGGTMTTTGRAVQTENTGLTLDDVVIDSTTNQAISATVSDDTNRTVSLTDVDANGGALALNTTAAATGAITATIDNTDAAAGAAGEFGAVSFDSQGTGSSSLTMNDVRTNAGFTYDAASSGSLAVSMTDVTGSGAVSFDTTGSGGSSLTMDTVDTTGGTFGYTTAGTSTLDVTMNTVDGGAVTFATAGTGASSIMMNDVDTAGGAYTYSTAAGGANRLAVDMDTVEGGAVSFDSNSTGDSSLAIRDSTTTAGYDYDVDGTGDLAVTMTSVTGAGDTTLDITSDGNGLLTMSNVNTGGAITANSTAGANGDLIVGVTNSGNTTAFTAITVNDLGDGAANASFTNVTSTAGVDFDSAGDGSASLSVSGGTHGDINGMATNTDTFTATVSGNTHVTTGDISLVGNNTGVFTANVGGTTTVDNGDIVITGGNTGAFTANVTGTTNTPNGDVLITATNSGAFTSNVTGATAGGQLSITKTTTGNSTINLDNLDFTGGVVVDSSNTGTIAFTMQDVTVNTGANITAASLNFGPNITGGGVNIFGANNLTTLDGSALDVNFRGGAIQYRLANSTFQNNSGTLSTVDVAILNSAKIDTTVTGNTFTNQDGGGPVEFLIATLAGGSPVLNIDINSNDAISAGGGSGSGEFAITEGAGGDVNVFELDDTFDNNRNTGTFNPDNRAVLDNLANPPAQP